MKFHPRPHFRLWMRASVALISLWQLSLFVHVDAAVLCVDLLLGCTCLLGRCGAEGLTILSPLLGTLDICDFNDDCYCDTNGECVAKPPTLSPTESFAPSESSRPSLSSMPSTSVVPSLSLTPSVSTSPSESAAPSDSLSPSSSPSESMVPSPPGGLSLCALINPCSCLLGQCRNALDLAISAAGICIAAADCACDELTGVCDTATSVPSARPSTSLVPSTSLAPSDLPSSSLAPSPPGGLSLCALINPCSCLLGQCQNALDFSISAAGICIAAADCACDELTGVCDTATSQPSMSLAPSGTPSRSLAPSSSLAPSPSGGISLCALINPCACVAGACENVMYTSISAAGICVVAADCSCNEITGVCDTATAAPSVSLSPSESSSPSQSPSSSLAPSLSLVPSPPGGISLCALINPCACVAGACENVLYTSISAAGICVVAADCSCNEITGVCDTATAAPSVSLSPSISSSPSQSPSSSLAPSLSLVPSPPGGISLCALINPCACVAGACENVLDASISAAGICVVAADCSCNELTGVCDTATVAPSVSLSPSISSSPSQSPSSSLAPSLSLVPSPPGGISLCALVNPCACVAGACENVLDASISAAGICVVAVDCSCNELTGVCDTATAAPSVSLSPSISSSPSQSPSSSLAPSSSLVPSPPGGISLCALINPCACVAGACENVLDASISAAGICVVAADCSCNEVTGVCDTATAAPSVTLSPSESFYPSQSSLPSVSSIPSTSSVPSASSSPSVSSWPSGSIFPTTSSVPSTSQSPSTSSIPSESISPSITFSPSASQFPSFSIRPTSSFYPSASSSPSESTLPSISSFPSESLGPTLSLKPSLSMNPSISSIPSESSFPSISSSPSTSHVPSFSIKPSFSMNPSLSSSPSESALPSISSSPSTSQFPSSSSSPSLSLQPSVSLQPSLSIKPSVSSNPSISLLPTTSQLPSASPSTSPSNSKEPTHLPSQTPSVSMVPSANPSGHPSLRPSTHPSISLSPTAAPSSTPSISHKPSDFPTSSPSAYPSRDCQAPTIGCGFGMWNYYTCECQCISPYCPDATGACYQTYSCPIDNYFEGCSHDCPWYADTLSETCVQGEVVPTGVSQVYMTKMRCCQAEFPNSVSACMDLQGVDEAYWYPDWTSGSSSCRNDGNQPDYMNADAQYWLFEDPYQCCKKYFGWDEDSCISSSIQGTDYVPPPSSPNVVLYYSCRICFSDCPNILNNLDESIPIIGNAIFSAVCNGNCNTGDSVQFDSVCGQSVDIDIPYSGNRRLKEGLHRRKVQTVITPCIEFTIKIYAQSASEAAILYNHLYLVLGTSPTQFDTLQTIQSYIQMVASTSLPLLSAIVIDGYSHVSYSIIGLSPNYYPDWGHTETCKNDGGEPAYMVNNPSYFSSSMEECCERYYYWKKNECMNAESAVVVAANPCSTSSSSSTSSGSTFTGRYYPDWTNGNRCLSDGNEPDYMRAWPVTWIFDNLEDCCDQHFQWDIENCMSSVSSSNPCNTQVVTPCVTTGVVVEGTANTIGTYYPDWLGSNLCVNDGNAPQYMKNWPYTHPAGWFFVTLEDCCRQHFSWTLSKCLGYVSANPCPVNGSVISTATTATPLTTSTTTSDPNAGAEWYVDWTIYRCVQSCDGPSPCGGLASYWEETYETAERCCAEHLSYQNECTP